MYLMFITDARNNIGHPTRRSGWILNQIKKGKVRLIRRYGKIFHVQLLDRVFDTSKTIDCEFRIGIDPGYSFVGFSFYKITSNKIVRLFCGELKMRTSEIKKNLLERKMYRRNRRRCRRLNVKQKLGCVKFRHPRWRNRRGKEKFSPTCRHLIESHMNLIKKIMNLVDNDQVKIHLEYAKFDTHKMLNPFVKGFWYQKGVMSGFESVKSYVKFRDGYKCLICGSKIEINAHHIISEKKDGTNRPDNFLTLCRICHLKIHASLDINPNKYRSLIKPMRDSGVLNTCMKEIFNQMSEKAVVQTTCGYITSQIRKEMGIDKSHSNDAHVIALCDENGLQEHFDENCEYTDYGIELQFIQKKRHKRVFVSSHEDRKYYLPGSKKATAWNRRKRTDQTKPSLEDFRKKNKGAKVIVKPGRKVYYKPSKLVQYVPGDKYVYDRLLMTCKAHASTQGRNFSEEYEGHDPWKKSKRILRNRGMTCLEPTI